MSTAKTDSKAQAPATLKAPEVPTLSALEEDDEFEEFVAEGVFEEQSTEHQRIIRQLTIDN